MLRRRQAQDAGHQDRPQQRGTTRSVFEVGIRKALVRAHPGQARRPPRDHEDRDAHVEQHEVEKLLAAPHPTDTFDAIEPTLCLTAATTGLRHGELIGLRWPDVAFDARRIRVVSAYVRGEFGDPKSAGSGRSAPMAERVAVALDRRFARASARFWPRRRRRSVVVVLFADTWRDHILAPGRGHGEMAPHLEAVMSAIAAPDHREPDERAVREGFYKRDVGPSRWLMVVVDFGNDPARMVTALG